MSNFLDLEDYKLQTVFDREHGVVLHRSHRADWANGRGRVVVEEKWHPQPKVLGAGTFGTVRLEARQSAGGSSNAEYRAVKQLRKMDMTRMNVDVRKELLALTKFSRPKFCETQAFVNFLGWFEDEENIYIAMEYFQHGTLDEFIKETLSENNARIITLQLLEGLKVMHDEHFTHRDLKPENIFVVQHSPNWWIKIGDFGISKRVANNDTALRTSVGTPLYLAPEVFHYVPLPDEESDVYTNAVDMWSLACVVYTMLALRPPFMDWPRKMVTFCNGGKFPEAPLTGRTSPQGIEFIKSILVPLPGGRPTAKEALKLAWVQDESLYKTQTPTVSTKLADYDNGPSAPLKPIFGVHLSGLYKRDGLAIPPVVIKCMQAVDLFGLDVEGIYRQSGSLTDISKLKYIFDTDSASPRLDFSNPKNFYHDINNVTGLLKRYFIDLPDPLLTWERHDAFISAAKVDDNIVRRDSLHAMVNALPDANYATLRALCFHLYGVVNRSQVNRMNSYSIAVMFGPILMGIDSSKADTITEWQIRAIDTIVQNTYQIFDED